MIEDSEDIRFQLTELQISLKSIRYSKIRKKQTLSDFYLTITLLSTTVGVGILSLPIAAAFSGIILYIILLTLALIIEYFASIAILETGQILKAFNYSFLVQKILGKKKITSFIHFLMFFSILMNIVAMSIILQQSLSTSFRYFGELYDIYFPDFLIEKDSVFWIFLANFAITPLIFYQRYANYKIISCCSLGSILIVISILFYNLFFSEEKELDPEKNMVLFNYEQFLHAFPILAFSIFSDNTLLDFANEIEFEKQKKIKKALKIKTVLIFILYLLVGIISYIRFGDELIYFHYGNILLSYEFNKKTIILSNIFIIIFISFHNILKFKPSKEILTLLLRKNYRDSKLWTFFSISIIQIIQICISCILIKLAVRSYFIFILIGVISPVFAFLLPFIFFHKVFYYDRRKNFERRRGYFLLFLSFFIGLSVIGYYGFFYLVFWRH